MPRPALVYCSTGTTEDPLPKDVRKQMQALFLYRWDDMVERPEDLWQRPEDRPVLRWLLCMAKWAAHVRDTDTINEAGLGFAPPKAVVIERRNDLGPTEDARVAVLHALMLTGLDLYVEGIEQTPEMWKRQYPSGVDGVLQDRAEALLSTDKEHLPEPVVEAWRTRRPDLMFFYPSSLTADPFPRAEELSGRGLPPTEVARRLLVEGYPNHTKRVHWYPKNVQDLLNAVRS